MSEETTQETQVVENEVQTEETTQEVEAQEETKQTPTRAAYSTNEQIFEVWEATVARKRKNEISGGGVAVVAAQLGMKLASLQQRLNKMRKNGFPLSQMPRGGGGRRPLSDDDKNKQIAHLRALQAKFGNVEVEKETEADAKTKESEATTA